MRLFHSIWILGLALACLSCGSQKNGVTSSVPGANNPAPGPAPVGTITEGGTTMAPTLAPIVAPSLGSFLTLTWVNNASDATGFHIYRAIAPVPAATTPMTGAWTLVASVTPATTLTYSDLTVSPSTLYFYYVTAYDSGGLETAPSAVVSQCQARSRSGVASWHARKAWC